MTKKLVGNQKKFNKLMNGLNATWNCEGCCTKCEFNIEDKGVKKMLKSVGVAEHCGAIAIREVAEKMFTPGATKRMKKIMRDIF